jgi:hypothetical protein
MDCILIHEMTIQIIEGFCYEGIKESFNRFLRCSLWIVRCKRIYNMGVEICFSLIGDKRYKTVKITEVDFSPLNICLRELTDTVIDQIHTFPEVQCRVF